MKSEAHYGSRRITSAMNSQSGPRIRCRLCGWSACKDTENQISWNDFSRCAGRSANHGTPLTHVKTESRLSVPARRGSGRNSFSVDRVIQCKVERRAFARFRRRPDFATMQADNHSDGGQANSMSRKLLDVAAEKARTASWRPSCRNRLHCPEQSMFSRLAQRYCQRRLPGGVNVLKRDSPSQLHCNVLPRNRQTLLALRRNPAS